MVQAVVAAFPDLSFELQQTIDSGEGIVVVQWLMRATHEGQFGPLPRTGRDVSLPGIDVLHVIEDRLQTVQGYFDTGILYGQLGYEAELKPKR